MTEFETPLIPQFCSYWRRITVHGEWIMALCGAESPDELAPPETDICSSLIKCPGGWQNPAKMAYEKPVIWAIKNGDPRMHVVLDTNLNGMVGINELESRWDEAEVRFRELKRWIK